MQTGIIQPPLPSERQGWQQHRGLLFSWFPVLFLSLGLALPAFSLAQDTDGDTVLDGVDFDNDNDGVLDILEGFSDGIFIFLDPLTPIMLSGIGKLNDAKVGDFFAYPNLIDEAGNRATLLVEVLEAKTTDGDIRLRISFENIDAQIALHVEEEALRELNDDLYIEDSWFYDEGTIQVANEDAPSSRRKAQPGISEAFTNVTLTFGDIDSELGEDFTEVFGYSTATPPDMVTLPGSPTRLEQAGFINGDGPGPGYVLYRLRRDVAGDPTNWADESNADATPDVSVQLFFRRFSRLNLVFGVTGSTLGPTPRKLSASIDATLDLDTDNDGITDRFDRDTDNDGLTDLTESGQDAAAVDTNNDGVHDGPVNDSGIPLAAGNGFGVNPVNSDADNRRDVTDLDSDGDGIPDNVEAQGTLTYVAPSGMVDATGIDINGALTPIDTDGDGVFDYRDPNSDNDGQPDAPESGLPAGTDANGDGIADSINASFTDVNGDVNNPATDLKNTSGTPEVDFRNPQVVPVELMTFEIE